MKKTMSAGAGSIIGPRSRKSRRVLRTINNEKNKTQRDLHDLLRQQNEILFQGCPGSHFLHFWWLFSNFQKNSKSVDFETSRSLKSSSWTSFYIYGYSQTDLGWVLNGFLNFYSFLLCNNFLGPLRFTLVHTFNDHLEMTQSSRFV